MIIKLVDKGSAVLIAKIVDGERPQWYNHSAGGFIPSVYQASHFRSRRLAEAVQNRMILTEEAKSCR